MVRLSKIKRSDEYWSIDYEFAGIDTANEKRSLLRVVVSKVQLPQSDPLVLIDDPIKSAASINNPDIRREMEQTWSNVIALPCSRAQGQSALGRASTLTIYTPRYLYQN